MKLLYNRFLITADAHAKATLPIKGHNGEFLELDKEFDPYLHATQVGEIYAAPHHFDESSIDSRNLLPGTTVWFHHHVCQPKNKWMIQGDEYYQCHFSQIWAKVENEELIPMDEWLFLSPIPEADEDRFSEAGLELREGGGTLPGTGIVFAASEHCKKMGLIPGEKVYFVREADYSITIGGKDLWRMKLSAIVAIERNGELFPLADKILIKEHPHSDTVERNGLILPWSERDKQLYGTVQHTGSEITCCKAGDEIVFYPGIFTSLRFKDQDYSIVRKDYLLYLNPNK